MSMEVTAWMSLHHAMHQRDQRPFSKQTLKRIGGFARPHRRLIAWFLVSSVVAAVLTVAAPVLAGRVIDAIVTGTETSTVVWLAGAIAVIALAEAGLGRPTPRQSPRLGGG